MLTIGKCGVALVLWIAGAGSLAGQRAVAPGLDAQETAGLGAMREKAVGMKVDGVALMAYFEGEKAEAWTSRMIVVGKMTKEPTATSKGANLLAVAYSKAAEMADTLKDSGSGVRPPMNGEFGYQGGLIARYKNGYLLVVFSGGKAEEDLAISRAGLGKMVGAE